jgi:TPR repeat protein
MYYKGEGVAKNNDEARKWYAKAKDIKDISLIVFEDER